MSKEAPPDRKELRIPRDRRYAAFTLALALGVTASSATFLAIRARERESVAIDVNRGVAAWAVFSSSSLNAGSALVEQRVRRIAETVTGTPEVTREAFQTNKWNFPPTSGLVNFEYLPRVKASEREAFEERIRENGLPGFTIRDAPSLGPAPDRSEYFPILFESWTYRAKSYAGVDMRATMLAREVMDRARDRAELGTYGRVPLNTEAEDIVFRYFMPVYDGPTPSTVEERRERLRGYVVAAYYGEPGTINVLIPDVMRGLESGYFRATDDDPFPDSLPPRLQREARAGLVASTTFTLNDREIRVVGRALPELMAAHQTYMRWLALALGLVGTAWISGLLLGSTRREQEIRAVVAARTIELQDRTEALAAANRSLRDEIEERRRAEELLRENEARYRLLAENASDVIYTHDLNFICTYISPSIHHQRGYVAEEMIGQSILHMLTPESQESAKGMLSRAIERLHGNSDYKGMSGTSLMDARCKDGSVITIENKSGFLFSDDGEVIGVLGVSRDVTERTRVEREKEELEAQYRHVQKMEAIGTLAGGVAHDFNNLLTGILGSAELMRLEDEEGRFAHDLGVIEKAAQRARELTGRLLGFARRGKLQSAPVDLNEAIAEVTTFLERTLDKSIEVELRLSDRPTWMSGDPSQIHQILLNLAINARDAMPSGGRLTFESGIVELDEEAAEHAQVPAGTYNRIRVMDTGCGIAPNKIERIFEPYFTDKEPGAGTGMGLAMVYGVTTGHGGSVTAHSEEGRGSTFEILLPYVETEPSEEREPVSAAAVHGTGRILVIDDEDVVQELACTMLSRIGYSVDTAANGVEGVEHYRTHWREIDLVIIDVIMPNMGGLECLEHLQRINPELKAVMSTGYSAQEITAHLDSENVVGLLQKPYGVSQLSELLADTLREPAAAV